jgi:hypothetical protein
VGIAPSNAESYVDLTTIPGTAYRYRLVNFNASGDAAASVTSDVTPAVAFDSYTVTPSAGPNGTISPASPVGVPVGSPQDVTFTMTPDPGYHVADVMVDGASVGAVTSHTITGVAADHTIAVTFAVNEYPITATAGPNGSIVWATEQNPMMPPADPAPVQHDVMLKTYTFVPDPGYRVADVLVDGVSVGAPTFYTFSNIT